MTTTAFLTDRQDDCADSDYRAREIASPTMIEVQRPRSSRDAFRAPGLIGMLVGPRGSRALEEAKPRLQSGTATLAELIAQHKARARTGAGNCRPDVRFTLKYLRHTILSLVYADGAPFCVAEVPYCGGELSREAFCVEQAIRCDVNLAFEPVVVIEPPVFSNVEASLTAAMPFTMSLMGTSQWIGSYPGLMIMEQGWAVAGYLAKVAAAQQLRDWRESDNAAFTRLAGKQATGAEVASPRPNLALSADRLLDLYRSKVMADTQI
jgi:hypothetical protein